MSHLTRTVVAGLSLAVLSLAGCSNKAAPAAATAAAAQEAVFHTQDGFLPNAATEPCLLHQTAAPTTAYKGGTTATLSLQLPFMAYYRANGTKAFCDAKAATDVDKQWAALYVTLTNNAADVAGISK